MSNPKPAAPPPEITEPLYPVIESFVEHASQDDVGQLFAHIKEGLAALKGPKAEQSKKVQGAIERTEELLQHLIGIREKLETEKKSPKGRK